MGPGGRAVRTRRYRRYSSNLLCSRGRRVWISALNLIIFEKNTKATFCGLLTFLQLWSLPEAGKEYLSAQLLVHSDTPDPCAGSQQAITTVVVMQDNSI